MAKTGHTIYVSDGTSWNEHDAPEKNYKKDSSFDPKKLKYDPVTNKGVIFMVPCVYAPSPKKKATPKKKK